MNHGIKPLTDIAEYWHERAAAELTLASGLCELHPAKAASWRKLIAAARGAIDAAVGAGKLDRLPKAVTQSEQILAPIAKAAKRYTIHCVGHAHIDMNWMWSWPETVATTVDTFATVLRLMDEFPTFRFTQSQASVYEIARRYNADIFAAIKRRVAEGRWEIAASQWVEGDKNIASGESLARHLLYTRRYLREHFDLPAEHMALDWEPDTFGHAATIPTILSRGGVKWYYLCRGGAFEKPPVFWWKGPDGGRVLVNLETTWYNDTLGSHVGEAMVRFCKRTQLRDWMCVYGVGDHGGGPTRRDVLRAIDMNDWPVWPNVKFALARDYFALLERAGDNWPTLDVELNYEFTGCYSSQSLIKQTNSAAESLCIEADAAALLAGRVAGSTPPREMLRQAWIDTLFGHFHDILPGSCTAGGKEYHLGKFQEIAATAGSIKANSWRAVARHIDTTFAGEVSGDAGAVHQSSSANAGGAGFGAGAGGVTTASVTAAWPRAVAVFNPVAMPRQDVIRVKLWDASFETVKRHMLNYRFGVRLSDGTLLPAQRIDEGAPLGHQFVELAVPVEVGAMGYTCLAFDVIDQIKPWVSTGYATGRKEVPSTGTSARPVVTCSGALAMENDQIAVDFDSVSGGMTRLVDKASGVDLAAAGKPMGVLEYILQRPGGMSAWANHPPLKSVCPLEIVSLKRKHSGPYLAAVEAVAKINDSRVTVTYLLGASSRWVEIMIAADWLERGGAETGIPCLAMRFPTVIASPDARYETPMGWIARQTSPQQEVPALRWADLCGKAGGRKAGLALLNSGVHSHSTDAAQIRVMLLRSTYEPDPLPEIGRRSFRLAAAPHAGLSPAELTCVASQFHHRLAPVSVAVQKGDLPPISGDVLRVRQQNVVVAAVKPAEDGDAMIVRLVEMNGRAVTAYVEVDERMLGRVVEVSETDLLEQPVEGGTARATTEGFSVRVPARGIATIRVTLGRTT